MSIRLSKSDNSIEIAIVKDKQSGMIVQTIYMTNLYEEGGGNSKSKKNPGFEVVNNVFTLPDKDKYVMELSAANPPKTTSRGVIVGQSGSGKSYFAAKYMSNYINKHKNNDVFLFSTHDSDESIDKVKGIKRIKITEQDIYDDVKSGRTGITRENLKNSLCVFDDTFGASSKLLDAFYYKLATDISQNSRRHDTSALFIVHNSDYKNTRMIFSESTFFVFFVNTSKALNKRFMRSYLEMTDKQAEALISALKGKTRHLVIRNASPTFYMTETMIFTDDYLRVLIRSQKDLENDY